MNIKNILLRIISVPYFKDEEDAKQRRLLNIVLLVAILAAIFIFIGVLLSDISSDEALDAGTQLIYPISILTVIVFILLYTVNRFLSREVATAFFILFTIFIIPFADLPHEVAFGRSLIAFTLPIIFAGMVLPPLFSYLAASLSSIILIFISHSLLGEAFPNIPAIIIFFVLALVSHITSRGLKKALEESTVSNKKLKESEDQFRSIFDGVNDAILVETPTGDVLDVNKRACEMFGWDKEEFLTKTIQYMVPPDVFATIPEVQDETTVSKTHFETINMRAKGELFPVSITARIQVISGEKRLLIVARDITEQKKAEEELHKLSRAITYSPTSVVITDVDAKINYVNPAYLEGRGYSEDEVLGQYATFLYSDLHPQEFYMDIWKKVSGGDMWRGEVGSRTRSGETTWDAVSIAPIFDADGKITNFVGVMEDITANKRLLEETEKAKEELQTLSRAITQSPAAIVITDLKGTIEYVNPAFTKITGYTEEEVLGNNPRVFQSGYHSSEFYKVLWETISTGKTWRGDLRNKSKTGKLFWESASISPVANAEGEIKHYVAVKEDITLRKKATEELERAKEAAEAAAQAKTDFLANMSHEIRTPLNAIYGMTSLMLDTPLNEEQQDFIKTIRGGSDTLLSIINDILDFSKIEAGKMELEEQPFRLISCIEDVLDLLAEKSAKKMLDLAYIIEDGVPPLVIGDVTRIRQILVNLLNNALKFTDKGEVVVLLKSMLLEKDQYELQFSVRDTGIGIPEDKQDRLFQSFSQVDSSTTRKYGGTGLGLVISKELAEKMGGRMWVESDVGKGSTFHFTIIAKAEDAAPLIANEQHPNLNGKRVLIVDDNATNRLILVKQTKSWGMKPKAVETGDEALTLFEQEDFDIAILDMQMPEMDGFTLAERISDMDITNALPMIILTSIKREKTRASDSKIAAFLNKPIKRSNLFKVLNNIISSSSEKTPKKKTIKEKTIDATLADKNPLRILLVEDNMINQKVASKLLSRLGYQSDLANNGLEAIEALERQTYDVVFMDIQMPEMDGDEATKRIREKWSKDRQPHIIAMTAHALEGDREKYLARGMDDYISKPIKVDALVASLKKAPRID